MRLRVSQDSFSEIMFTGLLKCCDATLIAADSQTWWFAEDLVPARTSKYRISQNYAMASQEHVE